MLFGIHVALEFGSRNVLVENGCLHLVNAISSREQGGSSLHLILDDIVNASSMLCFVLEFCSYG